MSLTSMYLSARTLMTNPKVVAALEYGLNAALIATVIIGSVTALGTDAPAMFHNFAGR